MANLAKLGYLDLTNTQVSEQRIGQLKKALPQCQIVD